MSKELKINKVLDDELTQVKVDNNPTPIEISKENARIKGNLEAKSIETESLKAKVKLNDSIVFGDDSNTYITSTQDDQLLIVVGGEPMFRITEGVSTDKLTTLGQSLTVGGEGTTGIVPEGYLYVVNAIDSDDGGAIVLRGQRGASGSISDSQNDDTCGFINFGGYDNGTPSVETYAQIKTIMKRVAAGAECGELTIKVVSGATDYTAMTITGMSETDTTVTNFAGGVGFTQITASFDATDTVIDFTAGHKQILTLTADITDVHFKFPNCSGNFQCIFLQDGTGGWDVSNWKTQDYAGNAGSGNSGVIKWSGGTATSLTETANKADIISIYWDNTNEIGYAVASEDF